MADFFGVLAGRWRSFIELLARPEIPPRAGPFYSVARASLESI
jgi:hypothetical protein